jgi:hypothetical protein
MTWTRRSRFRCFLAWAHAASRGASCIMRWGSQTFYGSGRRRGGHDSPLIQYLRRRERSMPYRPLPVVQLGSAVQHGGDGRRPHRMGRNAWSRCMTYSCNTQSMVLGYHGRRIGVEFGLCASAESAVQSACWRVNRLPIGVEVWRRLQGDCHAEGSAGAVRPV